MICIPASVCVCVCVCVRVRERERERERERAPDSLDTRRVFLAVERKAEKAEKGVCAYVVNQLAWKHSFRLTLTSKKDQYLYDTFHLFFFQERRRKRAEV